MASTEEDPAPNTTFIPSPSFVITCACLTLDTTTSTVLLAHAAPDAGHALCLPQGPKKIDEGLVYAAVRHTLESTGISVEPLRLHIPTRAAVWHYGDGHSSPRDEAEVVEHLENSEPFAACVSGGDVRRIVFYFLAGRKERREGEAEAEGGVWVSVVDVEEGGAGVTEEERMVIGTGVELARKGGTMS